MDKMRVTTDEYDEAFTIPAMREMPDDGYANYIDGDLFWIDHHDILRATIGQYPIATTPRQVDILVEYLHRIRRQMVDAAPQPA